MTMKRCSTSLVIMKTQIKTMRHQCVFQIGKILEFKNTKCLECKQRELSHIVLELQIKIILENNLPLSKLNVCIPRNPAIPFVAILKNICALENMKQYKSTHLLIICITARKHYCHLVGLQSVTFSAPPPDPSTLFLSLKF